MKTKLILLLIFTAGLLSAQAPRLINYQGVARGLDGLPITDENLGIQFEILRSSTTGSVVYNETQTVQTNSLGLILTQIGKNGTLSINWANGPYYLRVSVDVTGGTNYLLLGTQEIMSVPYSLHAQTIPASYTAATNRLEVGGNTFTLSSTPPTTINTTGVATVTNNATNNFVISVPASSISVTNSVGAAGVSTTGVNAFNINIPAAITPTVKGAGAAVVTPSVGTNFTVTVPPADIVVTSTSAVAGVGSPGTNSFVVNVPSPTIQAFGLATASSVGNLHTINVPLLTYAQSSGFLSSGINGVNITPTLGLTGNILTVGPPSNIINLTSVSPWRQATGSVTLATMTDKVGIGTASPAENLQVQSTAATSVSILSGNSNVGELQFGTNAAHGLGRLRYDNTTNTLSIWTGSVPDRIYIDASGRVGIGTNTVVSKLDVLGNLRVNTGTSVSKLFFGPVGGVDQGYTGIHENNSDLVFSVFKSGAPSTVFGSANSMEALFIKSTTGNVGVGTSSPVSRFEVIPLNTSILGTQGQSSFYQHSGIGSALFAEANNSGSSSGSTSIYSRAMLAGFISGQTPLNTTNTDVGVYGGGGSWGMLAAGGNLTTPATYVGIAGNQYAGVFMGGNVGIGTIAPSSALEVDLTNAKFKIADFAPGTGSIANTVLMGAFEGKTGNGPQMRFQALPSTTFIDIGQNANGNFVIEGNDVQRLVVTNAGNVGVGTAAPTTNLHVQGTTRLVDGTQGANKVLTSDASGNATWENSSRNTGFHAYASSSVVQANSGAFTQVLFQTELHDPGNNFANNAYTCPSTGFYHFDATISWNAMGSGTQYSFVSLYKNGQIYKHQMSPSFGNYHSTDLSLSVPCNAGDVITIHLTQFSGTPTNIYSFSPEYTYFSGYRIY